MTFPNLNGNWVDLALVLVFVYFLAQAWSMRFWLVIADFVSFLTSILIAFWGYRFLAGFLVTNFSLPRSVANALGFLIAAVVAEALIGYVLSYVVHKYPAILKKTKWDRLLATVPALGEGLILCAFVLTLIVSLPLSPKLKTDVSNSKIGGWIIERSSGIESRLDDIFGAAVRDSLTYLTVKPGSTDRIAIPSGETILSVDEESELAMFRLVNDERRKRGIAELIWEPKLIPPARAHAEDMWEREYFGHVSPEGEDVGDRLDRFEVDYQVAGENLALAPTLSLAHSGLMNSEGHRANILEKEFKKIGIGVIDNGYYGKMFVQVFTN